MWSTASEWVLWTAAYVAQALGSFSASPHGSRMLLLRYNSEMVFCLGKAFGIRWVVDELICPNALPSLKVKYLSMYEGNGISQYRDTLGSLSPNISRVSRVKLKLAVR